MKQGLKAETVYINKKMHFDEKTGYFVKMYFLSKKTVLSDLPIDFFSIFLLCCYKDGKTGTADTVGMMRESSDE